MRVTLFVQCLVDSLYPEVGEAMVAQDWLATSANQLTYHGLAELHKAMREGELAGAPLGWLAWTLGWLV